MSASRGTASLSPRARAKLVYTILFGAGFDHATAGTVANNVSRMAFDYRGRNRERLMQAINDEIAACRAREATSQRARLRLVLGSGVTE